MTKRAIVVFLVGVNLILLATLILAGWRLPSAYAQGVPMASNYLMVAGEIRDGTDALYVVDLEQRRLHVFVPNNDQNNRRVVHRRFRDLEQDFRQGG